MPLYNIRRHSITRKSVFDALVAGCIPVLFSRASLSQYSWHVSEKDVDDVSVYIPMKDINENNINFIDVLKAIPPDELKRKQRAIASIAPRLQFAVLPQRFADVPRDAQGGQGSQKGTYVSTARLNLCLIYFSFKSLWFCFVMHFICMYSVFARNIFSFYCL